MKKIIISIMMLVNSNVYPNQTREDFLQAGVLYKEGKVQEALSLYQDLQMNYPSVWFNKALCYFSLKKYPEALAALRHAQKGAHKDLLKKIESFMVKVKNELHLDLDTFLYTKIIMIGSIGSDLFVQILFLLSLLCIIFFLFFKRRNGMFFVMLSICFLSSACLCGIHYWLSCQKNGVVVQDTSILFAGPHKEFHEVAQLKSGQEVKVVEQDQSWYKVDFHGVQGWAEKSGLELII